MARNSASGFFRVGIALASWLAAATLVQAETGADLSRAIRRGEERIELRLRERRNPSSGPEPTQPARTHEESIEPWELVGV